MLQDRPGTHLPFGSKHVEMRQQFIGPHHVPDDVALGEGSADEPAQRLAQPRHDRPQEAQVSRPRPGQMGAFQPWQEQRGILPAAVTDQGDPLARRRGLHPRDRQGGIDHADVLESQRLGVGQRKPLGLRQDLQDPLGLRRVHANVLVAVGRDRQQLAFDPIGGTEVILDRLQRQPGRSDDGDGHDELYPRWAVVGRGRWRDRLTMCGGREPPVSAVSPSARLPSAP